MHFGPDGGSPMLKGIVRLTPSLIEEFCNEFALDIRDINMVIPHQLNQRIADPLKKALEKRGLSPDVVYDDNIRRYGNCSGSSVALALDTCYREGKLKTGDIVLLIAWGAGLKIGLTGLQWSLPVFRP
jgi:3-oxoacyl-[acyl-carrier-protein] synthase-3